MTTLQFIAMLYGTLIAMWETPAESFRIDDLGYVYTIEEQSIVKYDQSGELLFIYSRMDLGLPSQLDTSDPLRPLVFYEETGSLVILDNTLTEQRVLRLWDSNLGLPSRVASGVNQEIWIYDELNKELVRLDERLDKQVSTGYLPALTGKDPVIIGMAERHEQVIVADAAYGLWIFDRFGTLVHRIPIDGLQSLRTHADHMVLRADSSLYTLSYGERVPVRIRPFQAEEKALDQNRGLFYQLIANELRIYRM